MTSLSHVKIDSMSSKVMRKEFYQLIFKTCFVQCGVSMEVLVNQENPKCRIQFIYITCSWQVFVVQSSSLLPVRDSFSGHVFCAVLCCHVWMSAKEQWQCALGNLGWV